MKKIPNMISTKDLMYITDMFNWNYTAYQKISLYLEEATDEDVIKILESTAKIHFDNCKKIINLLGGTK